MPTSLHLHEKSIGQVTKRTTVKRLIRAYRVIPFRSKAENANSDVTKGFA